MLYYPVCKDNERQERQLVLATTLTFMLFLLILLLTKGYIKRIIFNMSDYIQGSDEMVKANRENKTYKTYNIQISVDENGLKRFRSFKARDLHEAIEMLNEEEDMQTPDEKDKENKD